jgi:hypothetical protein
MQAFDFNGENPLKKKLEGKSSVSSLNFSPNGKYLGIAFESGKIEVRDGGNWELCCKIEGSHKKKIRVIEFTNDEENLLVGSDDKTLSLHSIYENTLTKLRNYSYHLAPILSASFDYSLDSSQFASASADQRVILWETNTGNPLQVFHKCFDEQVVTAVNFSRNGRYLFSGTANGQIIVHRMSTFFEQPAIEEDIEMAEISKDEEKENNENEDIENKDLQIQLSEDEEEDYDDDVGDALRDVDISDSDEEEVAAAEATPQEEQPETPLSLSAAAETPQNGEISGPSSVLNASEDQPGSVLNAATPSEDQPNNSDSPPLNLTPDDWEQVKEEAEDKRDVSMPSDDNE